MCCHFVLCLWFVTTSAFCKVFLPLQSLVKRLYFPHLWHCLPYAGHCFLGCFTAYLSQWRLPATWSSWGAECFVIRLLVSLPLFFLVLRCKPCTASLVICHTSPPSLSLSHIPAICDMLMMFLCCCRVVWSIIHWIYLETVFWAWSLSSGQPSRWL